MSFKNSPMNITLGYNSDGYFVTNLPEGPAYDSNKMHVSVKIIDNTGGFVDYTLASVTVIQNTSDAENLIEELLAQNTLNYLNQELYDGNTQSCAQNLIILSSILNSLSLTDKRSILDTNYSSSQFFLTNFGPQTNLSFDLNFDNIDSLQPNLNGVEIVNLI